MNRTGFVILFALMVVWASSQIRTGSPQRPYLQEYQQYDKWYREAEKLSLQETYTEQTEKQEAGLNRKALDGFKQLLPAIEKAGDDSLAFYCYYKIGTLEHYFDSLQSALDAYEKAIQSQERLTGLPDSLLFNLYVYSGGVLYNNNQFEQALVHYKKAEEIAARHEDRLPGISRLYNTLGALYYETGNFSQAKNYFEKSVSLLSPDGPSYQALLVNYQINLAATLTRLEEYQEARKIYESLLPSGINTNDILHNTGIIRYKLGDNPSAIQYFRRVQYNNNRQVRLMNDIGQAYAGMGEHDSARYYYLEAAALNQRWNGNKKNIQSGLTYKYLGDELLHAGQPEKALESYQQAIVQFCPGFDKTDIYNDPDDFSGIFSFINLFNTLTAKADAFQFLYTREKDKKYQEAALAGYEAAFDLAGYVERNYDSDEARLFLNKIKHTAHGKPIEISLQLYELTHNKKFLEEAWHFDQRNKASLLLLNRQEAELREKKIAGSPLLRKEASLRSAITRLSLSIAQVTDSSRLQSIRASIRDHEIELGKTREALQQDPAFATKEMDGEVPAVKVIQQKLDAKTALLSYHLSEKELLLLVITNTKFFPVRTAIEKSFFDQLDTLKLALHPRENGDSYNDKAAADLYRTLITPALSKMASLERLIIIPDDELHYLPFEVLQDSEGNYLVERFAIQYQYSAALISKKQRPLPFASLLAYAPFIHAGYRDTAGNSFSRLPASGEEVADLEGRILEDEGATKKDFLNAANRYAVIHLATHAVVNNQQPLYSYISFFPGQNATPADYKLYASEIYNMKLDSTRLVILSACETGAGQLVKGEGLMSLSRAFAYAGCPNIITSLWKAEDKTTAFLAQRLHYYLDKHYSKDKALQLAKRDLLNSKEINPRFKSPVFWGHLVFIGEYEPSRSQSNWWGIAIALIGVALLYILYKAKKPRSANGA